MSEPTREDIRIDDRRWTGCKQCWSNTSHVATDAELAALGYVRAAEATMIWNDRIAREAGYVHLGDVPIALCSPHGAWSHYFDGDLCWRAEEVIDPAVPCVILRGWYEVARGLNMPKETPDV
jgi:hypothetical protein